MINPIYDIPHDYCTSCNKENALECHLIGGAPINFSFLLKKYNSGEEVNFNSRDLSHFKCKYCNDIFRIFWKDDYKFPTPLRHNIRYDLFIQTYITKQKRM